MLCWSTSLESISLKIMVVCLAVELSEMIFETLISGFSSMEKKLWCLPCAVMMFTYSEATCGSNNFCISKIHMQCGLTNAKSSLSLYLHFFSWFWIVCINCILYNSWQKSLSYFHLKNNCNFSVKWLRSTLSKLDFSFCSENIISAHHLLMICTQG